MFILNARVLFLNARVRVRGLWNGQPESFGGLVTLIFLPPPGIPIPLQLFKSPSGQQGGVHTIKRAILFQTDKNAGQHLPPAHRATNKSF